MPLERREILFFFPEVQTALEDARFAPGGEIIPPEIEKCALIEALHTKNNPYAFHDQRRRMLEEIDPDLAEQSGVVFRARSIGALVRPCEIAFFVPDQVVREMLAMECRKRRIMLPSGAQKKVVVDLLMVGLRITMSDGVLELMGEAG